MKTRCLISMTAAGLLMLAPASSASAATAVDPSFIKDTSQAGLTEVARGRAISPKAVAPKVRDFAQQMMSDHSAANADLTTIANRYGATLSTRLTNQQQKPLAALNRKANLAFDATPH